jgi:peptide/nickel transport system substrate-binding protein
MSSDSRLDEGLEAGLARLMIGPGGRRLSRRALLQRGLALGLSVPALAALLAACGDDDDGDDDGGSGGGEATATSADGDATEPEDDAGDDATEEDAEGGAGTPINGGTLTLIQTGSIPDLDPQSAYDSDASAIFFGAYEMLLRLKGSDTFDYEPMLADSWESNADQTEWTFTIADGITFHDGTPCDAEAVVSSFQRFHEMGLGPVNVITRFVASPDDISAPDANTIMFKLSYGTDIFLAAMASQYGPLVVSPTAVEENATEDDPFAHEWFRENVVGTGPYRLEEHQLGDFLRMVRFEDYHRGWEGNHFDEIVFRNVEESTTRRQLLESGEGDALTQSLTPEDIVQLEEAGQLNVLRYDSTNADWVSFNYVLLPDPMVRQAMAWAFPYDDVRDEVFQGLIEATSGAITNTTLGYPADGFIYTTDLEMAKQLLDEAGFDYSQELEFIIDSSSTLSQATAELYQANLAEIGVNLKITELEEGQLTDLMYGESPTNERPHFADWGWWPDYNDAWNEIYPNFHTASIAPNGSNALGYSNATVDELLDKSSTLGAGDEYDQTIAEINRIMVEEDPAGAFYGSVQWYTVLNPDIMGFEPNPIYINTYNVYDMYRVEM